MDTTYFSTFSASDDDDLENSTSNQANEQDPGTTADAGPGQILQAIVSIEQAVATGEIVVGACADEQPQQLAPYWTQLTRRMLTKKELFETGIETLCENLLAAHFEYKEDVELAMRQIYEAYGGIPVVDKSNRNYLTMKAKNTWTRMKRKAEDGDHTSYEVPGLLLTIRASKVNSIGVWRVTEIVHPSTTVNGQSVKNEFGGLNTLAKSETGKSIPKLQRLSECPIHAYTNAILARLVARKFDTNSQVEQLVTLKRATVKDIQRMIQPYITSTSADDGLPLSVSHIKAAALKLVGEDKSANASSMPTLARVLESHGHGVKHSISGASAMKAIAETVRKNENKYIKEFNKGKNSEQRIPLREEEDMPEIPNGFQFTSEFFVAPHYWKDLKESLFNHDPFGRKGNGLLPVVFLDAAHLGEGGIIYTLSSLNSNRNIALLAYGYCVDNESESTWTSFLTFCAQQYPSMNKRTITALLDSDKGGWNALVNCFPRLQGFRCHHHLNKNMVKKIGQQHTREFFKLALDTKAGLATRTVNWVRELAHKHKNYEYITNLLKGENLKTVFLSYSSRVGQTTKLRAFRAGIVASSVAESVNAALRKKGIRNLSALNIILGTLQWSNEMYLKWKQKAWSVLNVSGTDDMMPTPYVGKAREKFMAQYMHNASIEGWKATTPTENSTISEVTTKSQEKYKVDLGTMQCSCNWPQLNGLPCNHVYKACVHVHGDGWPFANMICHTNYTVGRWRSQYPKDVVPERVPTASFIHQQSRELSQQDEQLLHPPMFYPIKRGRPKNDVRYKSILECLKKQRKGTTEGTEGPLRLLPLGGAGIGVDIEYDPHPTYEQLQREIPSAFREDGRIRQTRKCGRCKTPGHNARTCPQRTATAPSSSTSPIVESSVAEVSESSGAEDSVEQESESSGAEDSVEQEPESSGAEDSVEESESSSESSGADDSVEQAAASPGAENNVAQAAASPGAENNVAQAAASPGAERNGVLATLPRSSSVSDDDFCHSDMMSREQLRDIVNQKKRKPKFPRSDSDNLLLKSAKSLAAVTQKASRRSHRARKSNKKYCN